MDDNEFGKIVDGAVKSLPKEFLEKLENVAIVIEDWPSGEQSETLSKTGQRGLLFRLYQGIPQTRRQNYGVGPTLPDKITIFKIPILMTSESHSDAEAKIKDTVIHEIGHHFGLSDHEIRRAQGKLA